MSRCFPFPPPGYVPKARPGIIDLSPKKKHVEKKHNKEKRDNEKREHKEKRDKDRSKDKRKEKKDQKHKDRKKEKKRDKGRASEDIKAEGRTQGLNELHIKERWQKTDEGKDSKFEEELHKRTRDDGAENTVVERANAASATLEKERVAPSRVLSVQVGSVHGRNDRSGLPIENLDISLQKRAECIINTAAAMERGRSKMHEFTSSATAMEKERSKMHEQVVVGRGTEQSKNHGISRSMERVSGLVARKTEGSTAGMEKEKCVERSLVSNSVVPGFERGKNLGAKILPLSSPSATQTRMNVLGVETLSIHGKTEVVSASSFHSRIKDLATLPTIEKERASGSEMFPHQVVRAVEKDIHQKVKQKNKTQIKKAEDRTGHKDSDHSVRKSKAKDIDTLAKEKRKEGFMVESAEDIEHNKLRNFGKKDQIDTLNSKPLAPHKDIAIGTVCVHRNIKKRKDLDTNGYTTENDERPCKLPKMTSSSQSLVNGRPLELHLTTPSSISLKNGAINNLRPDRLLENKERKNSDISLVLLPHPDSKYLSQIYTVPKMLELPEIDDQEWLFNCYDSLQKSKIELEAEKIPQVFAESMKIDSTDILALPYVVPF